MKLRVLYHGNCFDGCSSAGLFARFFRERVAKGDAVDVAFTPLEHKPDGPAIAPNWLDADVNACVDFRYSSDPRLHWWFDHHVSAFQSPGDEEHFRADTSGQKFFDPTAKSCAGFLARTVAAKFGFDLGPVAELVRWAEIIDGALFPNAAMPVELREPALRLMTWIEANRDRKLADRFILDLVSRPLDEIVAEPYVAEPLAPLLEQHRKNVETVRAVARVEGGVVITDLLDQHVRSLNKFIVYHLFPEARYSVTLLELDKKTKIGVGSNPWAKVPRTHNIAEICGRYGGGGHPVVGAISVRGNDAAATRKIAGEVIATLNTP